MPAINLLINTMNKFDYIVVDDDTTNNIICELNIRRFEKGATVKLFSKPEEALEFINLRDNAVDDYRTVLFLDINMSTMTGWDFLDRFLVFSEEIRNQITIYILTSAIQDFDQEKKKYPFVAGFLSKPLTKAALEEIFSVPPLEPLMNR